jgi:hypothetical protein
MADRKKIGAAGAATVAAVLGGKAVVGTVHEASHLAVEIPGVASRGFADAADTAVGSAGRHVEGLNYGTARLGNDGGDYPLSGFARGSDYVVPPAPRTLIVLPPPHNIQLSVKVHSLYDQAEPDIISDINDSHRVLTESQINSLINRELVNTINADTKKSGSNISFEILTGKLKIQKSTTLSGIDISAGEVNVYKVSTLWQVAYTRVKS